MSGINELYGLLKGKVIGFDPGDAATDPKSPHVYIYVKIGEDGSKYKIAVNTQSASEEPFFINGEPVSNDLLFINDKNYNPNKITQIQNLENGFYPIKYHNKFVFHRSDYPSNLPIDFPSYPYISKDIAVDFIRSKLFNPCSMKILPSFQGGPDNDLLDFFQKNIGMTAIEKKATIYVYGGHFHNGKGIHEVHMNQGSIGKYKHSNGVYQDGCILLQYPDHWEAIFLAFQSQTWKTNHETGNSEGESYIYDSAGNNICTITS